jgi:NADH:ubiquinone oxidoreductase subunit 2 (subunit N)
MEFSWLLSTEGTLLILVITGSASLIIGSIALTQQLKLKRFLAFSSVSHIGFILLALHSKDLNSYIIYLFVYVLTTLNIFCILILLSQLQGREVKYIDQLIGIFRLNPFLGISFAINLFSLAGRWPALNSMFILDNKMALKIVASETISRTIILYDK